MSLRSVLCVVAVASVGAACAQEAFDQEQTKALFAGTEWSCITLHWTMAVVFNADGTYTIPTRDYLASKKKGKWTPSGPQTIRNDEWEWTLSQDKREIYAFQNNPSGKRFSVFTRGMSPTPSNPFILTTLAKPNTVWAQQNGDSRNVLVFSEDNIVSLKVRDIEQDDTFVVVNNNQFNISCLLPIWGPINFLIKDENGEWIIRNEWIGDFKQEAWQPGDPQPLQKIAHNASPLNGSVWRSISANNNTPTLSFKNPKEWIHYSDNTVSITTAKEKFKAIYDPDRNRLIRKDEVFDVFVPAMKPIPSSIKTIKETLESKEWVSWDGGVKRVYTFKGSTVSISIDDHKPTTLQSQLIGADCIRIGKDVFVLFDGALERIGSRLTLR